MGMCRVNAIRPGAAAQAVIDGIVQQGLAVTALINQQISGQNILPGPVEKGHLSPAMSSGRLDLPCLLQIRRYLFLRDSGI